MEPQQLRFKFVSLSRDTAMVTAIESGRQQGDRQSANEVQTASLQLVSFGYCHGVPRNCARTVNCSLMSREGDATSEPSVEALCSFLLFELQALVVSQSRSSAPVAACFSPPLSPCCTSSPGSSAAEEASCATPLSSRGTPPPPPLRLLPAALSEVSLDRPLVASPSPSHDSLLMAATPPSAGGSAIVPGMGGSAGEETGPRPRAPGAVAGGCTPRSCSSEGEVVRVAIGCADGLGMSVRAVEHLAAQLASRGMRVTVKHRELRRAARQSRRSDSTNQGAAES